MSSIPLPALGVKPPEQPDLLQKYGQMVQLKSLGQQQQIQQQEIQKNQADLNDRDAMTKAMQSWDGKDPQQLIQNVIKNKGSANAAMGLQQKILAQKETYSKIAEQDATTGAKNLESMKIKNDAILGGINALKDVPDDQLPQQLQATVQSLQQQGVLSQQEVQQAAGLAQSGDPAKIRQGLDFLAKTHQSQSQQMEQAAKAATIAKDNAQAAAANQEAAKTGKIVAGMSPNGITADQQATLKQGNQRIAIESAAQQETARHNKTQEGMLTPEALNMAAQQFASTGQMPQMGRDAATRKAIMNRAAELSPNIDLAGNAAAYKANAASLKGLQENLDSVTAFENTANKNLDLFVQQAKKVVDSGSPFLNTPLRLINQKLLGSTDQAAFTTARQVATNEIAKVTSNPGLKGQLSDSARHEVDAFNPENATLAQTLKVAEILKQDMANRHQSYDEQIQAIKKRISPGAKPANGGGFNWDNHPVVKP